MSFRSGVVSGLASGLAIVVLIGMLAALAGVSAAAPRRWIVSGTLDAVDPVEHTVEVGKQTIRITPRTRIKTDAESPGRPGSWQDVVDRDGEHVSLLVTPGYPHPLAKMIVLLDEPEDE